MATDDTINLDGMDRARNFLAAFPANRTQEVRDFLNRYGIRIQGDAMRVAPVGVSGDLKNDVQFQLTQHGEIVDAQLGFNVFYAKYVHGVQVGGRWIGPRRHFVSFRTAPSLERWARAKGIDTRRRNGLWVGGEDKARPFLYNAAIARQADMITAFRALGGVTLE